MKRYIVRLEAEERSRLNALVKAGKVAGYKIRHAQMLLMADADGPGWIDARIAEGLEVSVRQIEYLRQRFVEQGLEACLSLRKPEHPRIERMFDGEKEARLLALACSAAPQGRERWTLRLLADKAVELKIVAQVSHETVRQTLKKTRSSPT